MATKTETPLTEHIAEWLANHDATAETLAALVRSHGGAASRQNVWAWARGAKRPDARNLGALAAIFGMPVDDLYLMSRGFVPVPCASDR